MSHLANIRQSLPRREFLRAGLAGFAGLSLAVSNWEPQATIYGETTWSSTGWTQLPGSKRYKVTATLYYWQDLGQGKGKENKQVAASQEIQM